MIFLNAVRHEGNAGAILLAVPQCAIHSDTLVECRINLGVSKRLGLSVVPSPAGEGRDIGRETLFQIDAEAIFACDVPWVVGNLRHRLRLRRRMVEKLFHRNAVDAHIGVVGIREQAHDARFFRYHAAPQLIFPIFRMHLPRAPHQVNSVRHFRHQPFGETDPPVAILEIRHDSNGIAARVGGIIPGAVVIHRPVGKLKMRVGTNRIHVKEIRHAELAKANLQPPPRQFIEQRKKAALTLDLIFAQREHLVDHAAPQVRRLAQ